MFRNRFRIAVLTMGDSLNQSNVKEDSSLRVKKSKYMRASLTCQLYSLLTQKEIFSSSNPNFLKFSANGIYPIAKLNIKDLLKEKKKSLQLVNHKIKKFLQLKDFSQVYALMETQSNISIDTVEVRERLMIIDTRILMTRSDAILVKQSLNSFRMCLKFTQSLKKC